MPENHNKLGLVKKQEVRAPCSIGSLELWGHGDRMPRVLTTWGQSTQGCQDMNCRKLRALDTGAVGRPSSGVEDTWSFQDKEMWESRVVGVMEKDMQGWRC